MRLVGFILFTTIIHREFFRLQNKATIVRS